MIRQIETKLIPVKTIDMGHRRRQPSQAEVERMAKSIRQDGLLTAIGVQTSGDSLKLLYGATRLSAVQKLGWSEVSAVFYDGTTEELTSAQIIENLERSHLDKDQLDQLTKSLVELRMKEI
jgi:ParB-like chromosome segregation protein Spo0J